MAGNGDDNRDGGLFRSRRGRPPSEPRLSLEPKNKSGFRRKGRRVTMSFDGPPLPLPSDDGPRTEPPPPGQSETPLALEPASHAGALDLVDERSRPSKPEMDLRLEMRELMALDDFSGALGIAELLLGRDPYDEEALPIAHEAQRRLEMHYSSRLGGVGRRPVLAIQAGDMRWLGLDHRAGFLLSQIDGRHSVEQIVDVSGMPRLEALKTMLELYEMGAIALR